MEMSATVIISRYKVTDFKFDLQFFYKNNLKKKTLKIENKTER